MNELPLKFCNGLFVLSLRSFNYVLITLVRFFIKIIGVHFHDENLFYMTHIHITANNLPCAGFLKKKKIQQSQSQNNILTIHGVSI